MMHTLLMYIFFNHHVFFRNNKRIVDKIIKFPDDHTFASLMQKKKIISSSIRNFINAIEYQELQHLMLILIRFICLNFGSISG